VCYFRMINRSVLTGFLEGFGENLEFFGSEFSDALRFWNDLGIVLYL
jgi:hypothetical protein